ncbi:hypothetical protein BJV77DRAFT_1158298 [Russula vinacea]|nr:hypothetical protein BJV77DRAFT_1158298 [Russula vinacea]
MPNLDTTLFVLLLDPSKYSPTELYTPCHRSVSLFTTTTAITELHLEASHFTPGKPPGTTLSSTGDDTTTRNTLQPARQPKSWSLFLRSIPSVKVLRLYVSQPIEILTSISTADELSATPFSSISSAILPNLQVLHLFRCGVSSLSRGAAMRRQCNGDTASAADTDTDTVRSIFEGEDAKRTYFVPTGSRGPRDPNQDYSLHRRRRRGARTPAEALSLVDSVEPGISPEGIWSEPMFPRRLIPLLEEHLS